MKLKTLKDITFICCQESEDCPECHPTKEEIREEAIKWYKYYKKDDEEIGVVAQVIRMWIVKFFNLTEEDLE